MKTQQSSLVDSFPAFTTLFPELKKACNERRPSITTIQQLTQLVHAAAITSGHASARRSKPPSLTSTEANIRKLLRGPMVQEKYNAAPPIILLDIARALSLDPGHAFATLRSALTTTHKDGNHPILVFFAKRGENGLQKSTEEPETPSIPKINPHAIEAARKKWDPHLQSLKALAQDVANSGREWPERWNRPQDKVYECLSAILTCLIRNGRTDAPKNDAEAQLLYREAMIAPWPAGNNQRAQRLIALCALTQLSYLDAGSVPWNVRTPDRPGKLRIELPAFNTARR